MFGLFSFLFDLFEAIEEIISLNNRRHREKNERDNTPKNLLGFKGLEK